MNDVQTIADSLAAELNRAVFIDDASFRPLAASAQLGRVDDARVQALLSRSPTQEHLRYFTQCGVINARVPLRVPGSDVHGLLPRMVVPIVGDERVEGRLWLVDADPALTSSEIEQAAAAGRHLSVVLRGANSVARQKTAQGDQLLGDLQRAGARRRQALCVQLRDNFGLHRLDMAYPAVVEFRSAADRVEVGAPVLDRLVSARDAFVDLLGVPSVAARVTDDALSAVLSVSGTDRDVLNLVQTAAAKASLLHGLEVMGVGVGSAMVTSDGLGAAMDRAQYACRIARSVSLFERAARWSGLGEYQLFYAVPWNRDGVEAIHPGVAELLDAHHTTVASTLLCYLEREGDVADTARALNIHRTTLYYRLERATEAVGGQIAGNARFPIHAALRLAHLSGLIDA